jgi:regulator of PEP synthase PpsR (kinase-PPPase family)
MANVVIGDEFGEEPKPIVFVLSDARGKTAVGVVEAAADQFVDDAIVVKQLGNVSNVEMVSDYLDKNHEENTPIAVFHTIADKNLRRDIRRELDNRGIPSVDLLGPAVTVIASLTGEEPASVSGRRTDVSVMELH